MGLLNLFCIFCRQVGGINYIGEHKDIQIKPDSREWTVSAKCSLGIQLELKHNIPMQALKRPTSKVNAGKWWYQMK